MKGLITLYIVILLPNMCIGQRAKLSNCPYTSPQSLDMLSQRWINMTIETRNAESGSGELLYNEHPAGYFQLNSDKTYDRKSNGVPLKGSWNITDNCRLLLDDKTRMQRSFDIVKLTSDSLTISRRDGNLIYIQHYKAIHQPSYVMNRQYTHHR